MFFFKFQGFSIACKTYCIKNRLGMTRGQMGRGLGDFGGTCFMISFLMAAVGFFMQSGTTKIQTLHLVHSSSIHSFAAISSRCGLFLHVGCID